MIEREIDDVGRVVIPMEYRKNLGIEFNSKVLISSSRKTQKAEATKKHFRRGGYHPPEKHRKPRQRKNISVGEDIILPKTMVTVKAGGRLIASPTNDLS